jgi:hypothetical protein
VLKLSRGACELGTCATTGRGARTVCVNAGEYSLDRLGTNETVLSNEIRGFSRWRCGVAK